MELCYNGKTYPVILERKRVKNINLRVRSDGVICISAPPSVREAFIQEILERDAKRLAEICDKLQQNLTDYADGSTVMYLGEKLRLHWSDKPCKTTLQGGILTVFARTPDEAAYAYRLWSAEECVRLCNKLNPEVHKAFLAAGYSVPPAKIEIKEMTSRWGSCTARSARISINLRLMQYPEGCIRSVFYHEYTHFLHMDHGKGFYAVLRQMCPDYDKWDRILKRRES